MLSGQFNYACAWRSAIAVFVLATPGVVMAQAGEAAPAGPQIVSAPPTFDIVAIDVDGATKLGATEIERVVYPFMGPQRTSADVEAARKAVQDAYVKIGYEATVVEVPPQPQEEFASGLVRIRVSEAPVATVKVSGSKHHSAAVLLRQLPSVKSGEPLNFKTLQAELAVANRFPDREVIPSFDAGEVPGSINVDLRVRDEFPVHATLELNNDNSPNTTKLRVNGSVRYTNLFELGHTISGGFSISPENRNEVAAIFGSYTVPFLGSPWTLALSGYKSNSNIAALGGTNVLGNGYNVGLQAIYRVPSDRDYHAFRVGLDYKDFKQDVGLRGLTVNSAPISYIPLTLGYNMSMGRDNAALDVGLSSTLGLRALKKLRCFDPTAPVCLPEDQFTNREVDSVENFAHINLDITYTAKLPGDWVSEVRFSGQYADSHLVSNEQFAVGGLSTVRGYFQSEVVGDKGIAGAIEFRTPSIATAIGTYVDDLRAFSFMEGGIVGVIDPLPDAQSEFRIASFGGGVRLKVLGRLTGEVLVGVPVTSTDETQRGEPRYTFSLKGEF